MHSVLGSGVQHVCNRMRHATLGTRYNAVLRFARPLPTPSSTINSRQSRAKNIAQRVAQWSRAGVLQYLQYVYVHVYVHVYSSIPVLCAWRTRGIQYGHTRGTYTCTRVIQYVHVYVLEYRVLILQYFNTRIAILILYTGTGRIWPYTYCNIIAIIEVSNVHMAILLNSP